MKTIGRWEFPTNKEEAAKWCPVRILFALHSQVLLVAQLRIEGTWAAYAGPVSGISHREADYLVEESKEVLAHGDKVPESIARAVFPAFDEVPYAE